MTEPTNDVDSALNSINKTLINVLHNPLQWGLTDPNWPQLRLWPTNNDLIGSANRYINLYTLYRVFRRYARVRIADNVATYLALIAHWLCYFNSAINPVVYNLMSGNAISRIWYLLPVNLHVASLHIKIVV